MSEKEYFKIVWRSDDGTYTSFDPPLKRLSMTYRVGEVTLPPVGGVLVFETQEDLMRFIYPNGYRPGRGYRRITALRGVAGGTHYLPEAGVFPRYLKGMREIREFWDESQLQKWEPLMVDPWPKGTVAVRSFKPLEEVDIS